MVTLSILKLLENNGFGEIDKDLFWEKLGLNETGLYISDIGSSQSRTAKRSTTYEIFSRGESDVEGYMILEKVSDFLNSLFDFCRLPSVPPITDYGYHGVSFLPVSTISNVGVDINGRVIYSITGQVYWSDRYKETPAPPVKAMYLALENGKALKTENEKVIWREEWKKLRA